MKVMKFGGTSVGSAQRIMEVSKLVASRCAGNPGLVVFSAMSGTTNALVEISRLLREGCQDQAIKAVEALRSRYDGVVAELYGDDTATAATASAQLDTIFAEIEAHTADVWSEAVDKILLSQGEQMSSVLIHNYMLQQQMKVVKLSALDFMRLTDQREPDSTFLEATLPTIIAAHPEADLFITQGFICRDHKGEIDNLERGGSDYTASLIGAALNAEEIEIWTDIDGMHNNDPRFVKGTKPVHLLDFEEAAELAYFGAKILHPTCVLPAKLKNIPVRLLNTMQPDARGTLIFNAPATHTIKAVAAKDNITAIKIKSGRMLLAYGFLRKVFEIFENHRTPIDMITTSEVGVSVTIDNVSKLDAIVAELESLGAVTVDRDMVIICVVGDMDWRNRGFEASIVDALRNVPVRMISYGGSNYNISLLVQKDDKVKALNLLSEHLFNN